MSIRTQLISGIVALIGMQLHAHSRPALVLSNRPYGGIITARFTFWPICNALSI